MAFIQEAAARTRTAVERANVEAVLRASEDSYRRLNLELAEADKMKDEFLATLAHELRNPLAPIRDALTLQSIAAHDPGVIAQTRELMERQVDHMVCLIDDLLDLSRLSRGLINLRIERVSMAAAVSLALDASRPLIEKMSHELTVTLPAKELTVSADPVRITQIITNLLNNAAKFTPPGGKLALSLEREGPFALVRVIDNGIGIRRDTLDRVFNMFEQVHRSYAHVGGGLGIGLTLVRRLVEALGGSVRADSAGLGKGSEFSVRLPLATASFEPQVTAARAPAPINDPEVRRRILIADDNEDAAQSLAEFFRLVGHETQIAADGAEAVAIAKDFRPDVALLDIGMPVLDVLGAARAIRALPWGNQILLLALSGFGQDSDKQQSAEAGFDAHLVKPVELERLDEMIKASPRLR